MTTNSTGKKDARELLEIDVREVSLVDSPAIRREFLITKRRQEDNMSAFATEDRQTVDPSAVGIAKSGSDAGQVTTSTEPVDKAATEKEAAEKAAAEKKAAEEKAAAEKVAAEKKAAEEKPEDDKEVKIGPDGKPLPAFMQPKEKTETTKAADADLLGQLIDEVQKARSFTSPRIDQIKSAAAGLNNLLKTVDEGAFKAMLVDMKVLPADATVPQAVKPTGVTKAEGGEEPAGENTELADVKKRLADTEAKLDEVLKARNPSTSIDGDGDGDTKIPVEKNFWNGVI